MPDHGDLWILSLRSGDSLPNVAFGFLQGGGGLGSGHTGGEHHDRDWRRGWPRRGRLPWLVRGFGWRE